MAAVLDLAHVPNAVAGQVRRIELTEDHPATVYLALGRSTAISFQSRPEKVVPGSPQAIQINFLGSDLTVTPVNRKPGNLLVYTKSGRFVILFTMGGDRHYDDVVKVGVMGKGRPIRLLTDSFLLAPFKVIAKSRPSGGVIKVLEELTLRITANEQEISGSDLDDLLSNPSIKITSLPSTPFHCLGCVAHFEPSGERITCIKPIIKIHCESKSASFDLERRIP